MKNKLLDNLPTIFVILIVAFSFIITYKHAKSETKQQVVLINSGKAGGSFNARTQMYKDGLVAAGYDVKFENVGKISMAVKMFKESKQPTVMVYANNQVYKQDLFHTENNFIIAEYQQPLYVCRTNASKDKTGMLTVAHGKGYDPALLTSLLGSDITLVPYKNSGAMLKGILGGDVDMMVNNQGKSFKYMASGEGTCEVSNVLPTMVATVIGNNIDVQAIRKVIFEITMSIPFIEYHTTRKLFRPSGTWQQELALTQELEKGYEVK
jgi:hypothetical protein